MIGKYNRYMGIVAAIMVASTPLSTMAQSDNSPIDEDLISGERVINTTKLTPRVFGYAGVTPLKLFIVDAKVDRVELLDNNESPEYLSMVVSNGLLKSWDGVSISEVADLEVDGVSGATYSSNAIIENVKVAAKYAFDNKR